MSIEIAIREDKFEDGRRSYVCPVFVRGTNPNRHEGPFFGPVFEDEDNGLCYVRLILKGERGWYRVAWDYPDPQLIEVTDLVTDESLIKQLDEAFEEFSGDQLFFKFLTRDS